MSEREVKIEGLRNLAEGEMYSADIDGEPILLSCVQGQVYAVHGICTHGMGYLEEGFLDGFNIVCPLHAGSFDVRDGSVTHEPCNTPNKSYPVRISNGEVFVSLD